MSIEADVIIVVIIVGSGEAVCIECARVLSQSLIMVLV